MLFVLSVIAGVFNVIAAIYFQVAYANTVVARVCVCVSVREIYLAARVWRVGRCFILEHN